VSASSFSLTPPGWPALVARSCEGTGVASQDVVDEVLYLRSAGLDLGKRFLLACVRVPNPKRQGTWSLETERFGTTLVEVRRLLAWLTERQVELVVMEATSDYWRSVYYTLQESLNLMLVNPTHLKGIRGVRATRTTRRSWPGREPPGW
jgi:Transposase